MQDNIFDRTYLNILDRIKESGTLEHNRTDTDTLSMFGLSYRLPVSANAFPILTHKKVYWRSVVAELIWYLSGEPHIRNLQQHTKIWDSWASPTGNLESAYGRYWRYYPVVVDDRMEDGEAKISSIEGDYFDQIKSVVAELKVNPRSRRLHVTAWYPPNARVSKLPPCHHSFTLNYQAGKLNLHLQQRSCDFAIGAPFNLSCYSLLLLLVCREVNLEPGELYHSITDAHIYVDHLELYAAAPRITYAPPALDVSLLGSKSLFDLTYDDIDSIKLVDYQHGPFLKLPIAV